MLRGDIPFTNSLGFNSHDATHCSSMHVRCGARHTTLPCIAMNAACAEESSKTALMESK